MTWFATDIDGYQQNKAFRFTMNWGKNEQTNYEKFLKVFHKISGGGIARFMDGCT